MTASIYGSKGRRGRLSVQPFRGMGFLENIFSGHGLSVITGRKLYEGKSLHRSLCLDPLGARLNNLRYALVYYAHS